MQISDRAQQIEPFYVMEVAKAAKELALGLGPQDSPMIYLNIGEPDFTAPPLVQTAAQNAILNGATQYSSALGILELRQALSRWYKSRFNLDINAKRIMITAGGSAALQLACMALINPNDEILMPDPSYPCNQHFVGSTGGKAVLIPSSAQERFQLSFNAVKTHWNAQTKGVLLASPSNPTGTSIAPPELKKILDFVQSKNGISIIDEIYLPLSFNPEMCHSALELSSDVISINSFSKYFNMTGWRLGWMVAPESLIPTLEKLAQNLFICPSVIAQQAAIACFEEASIQIYETRRQEFMARRDYFIPALKKLGFDIPVMPDGAFYAWADCRPLFQKLGVTNSWDASFAIMQKAHVAVTPGRDFGKNGTEHHIRFSTANSLEQLQETIKRLEVLLA